MQNAALGVEKKTEEWGDEWGKEIGKKETEVHQMLEHSSQKQRTLTASEMLAKGRVVQKQNPRLHFPSPIPCDSYAAGEMKVSAPSLPLLLFRKEHIKTVRAGRRLRDRIISTPHFRTGEKEAPRVEGACLPVSHFTDGVLLKGRDHFVYLSIPQLDLATGPCTWRMHRKPLENRTELPRRAGGRS